MPLSLGLSLLLLLGAAAWLVVTARLDRRATTRVSVATYGLAEQAQCAGDANDVEVRLLDESDRAIGLSAESLGQAEPFEHGGGGATDLSEESIPPWPEAPLVGPRGTPVPIHVVVPPIPTFAEVSARKFPPARWGLRRGGWMWNVVTGLAIVAFLFVGYAFLSAARSGRFTFRAQILTVVIIALVVLGIAAVGGGL